MFQQEELEKKEEKGGFIQNFVETLIGNLFVQVSNIHLRYEDNISSPSVNNSFFFSNLKKATFAYTFSFHI